MARINIRWETRTTVAPRAASTGSQMAQADPRAGKLYADRPMLVYVTSDDSTDTIARKLEDVGFVDERVGIGAKFFQCIKISSGDALQDRLIKANGKATPRLLFIKRNYKVVAVLQNKKLKAGAIVKAMAKLAGAEYKDSFKSMVSKYAKLLNELDRLEGTKGQVADKARRLKEKPNASKAKKLEREKAAYEKAMEDWKKSEEKLLAFKSKPVKKSAA